MNFDYYYSIPCKPSKLCEDPPLYFDFLSVKNKIPQEIIRNKEFDVVILNIYRPNILECNYTCNSLPTLKAHESAGKLEFHALQKYVIFTVKDIWQEKYFLLLVKFMNICIKL